MTMSVDVGIVLGERAWEAITVVRMRTVAGGGREGMWVRISAVLGILTGGGDSRGIIMMMRMILTLGGRGRDGKGEIIGILTWMMQ